MGMVCGQVSAYFKFILSTCPCVHSHTHAHMHAHTHILIPFEDREPTELKVDIARVVTFFVMAALTQVVDGFRTRNWCAMQYEWLHTL